MKLDREYQREMLRRLADNYPEMSPETQEWFIRDLKSEKYITNAQYLIEHGLLSSGVKVTTDINGAPAMISVSLPKITAKGVDFIRDDGGLSAILSVQTVKLHEDTLKELLSIALQQAKLPEQEKESIKEAVKQLPAEGLKHLLTKLIDLGLSHAHELSALTRIFQNMNF